MRDAVVRIAKEDGHADAEDWNTAECICRYMRAAPWGAPSARPTSSLRRMRAENLAEATKQPADFFLKLDEGRLSLSDL